MKRRGEDGQALFVVAGARTALVIAAGPRIYIGHLRYQQRRQQAAANHAAIAGAAEINYGDVTQAAQNYSSINGYTNGSSNVTANVYNPPNDGPHAGIAGYVEVLVTKIQPTFFAKLAGFNNVTATTRAVAYAGSGQGCIYALAPSGTSVQMNGGPDISSQSRQYINSSSTQALPITQ